VRLSGEVGNELFDVECVPDTTMISKLKKLIKLECSPTLNHIDAPKLIIKGSDGNALREGILLSSRSEGKSGKDPYIVEVPKIGNIKYLIMKIVNIINNFINTFPNCSIKYFNSLFLSLQ